MPSLLVIETPWEDELESPLSVGPFLLGLRDAFRVKVAAPRFNGMRDLDYFLVTSRAGRPSTTATGAAYS